MRPAGAAHPRKLEALVVDSCVVRRWLRLASAGVRQVWSLNQFYSAGFLQQTISVKKVCFIQTHNSRFVFSCV